MFLSNSTSEQEKFTERFYKMGNDCLDWLEKKPVFTIIIIILFVISAVTLVISGIFKIDIINTKPITNFFNSRKKNKLLTNLPAGKPYNPSTPFPPKLRKLIRNLKKAIEIA